MTTTTKPNTPKINVSMLRKVQKAILDEPLKFDMENWFNIDAQSPCGTTACIAGFTIAISRKWKKLSQGVVLKEWPGDIAQPILGLTDDQRQVLFTAENWPLKFHNAYFNAVSPKGRARAAAKFIDHFIATKGDTAAI